MVEVDSKLRDRRLSSNTTSIVSKYCMLGLTQPSTHSDNEYCNSFVDVGYLMKAWFAAGSLTKPDPTVDSSTHVGLSKPITSQNEFC